VYKPAWRGPAARL